MKTLYSAIYVIYSLVHLTGLWLGLVFIIFQWGGGIDSALLTILIFPVAFAILVGRSGINVRACLLFGQLCGLLWPCIFVALLIVDSDQQTKWFKTLVFKEFNATLFVISACLLWSVLATGLWFISYRRKPE